MKMAKFEMIPKASSTALKFPIKSKENSFLSEIQNDSSKIQNNSSKSPCESSKVQTKILQRFKIIQKFSNPIKKLFCIQMSSFLLQRAPKCCVTTMATL